MGVSSAGGRFVLAVLQDGGDGLVGARVEQQRPRTGGVQALRPVALDEADNPDGGAEALFGMGT
jgi:hypothetical protein